MIADNRLTETSVWDDRLLAEQLKELSVVDLEFSLESTGFTMGEIDLRIEGLNSEAEDTAALQDESSDPPTGPPVTRPGDLWLLGENRVYCGSALDNASYAELMQSERAQAAFFDPPYNVRIENNVSGLGAVQHRNFEMASGGNVRGPVHDVPHDGLLAARSVQRRRCFALYLHGLASSGRITGGGPYCLFGAKKSGRLGEK